MVSVELKYIKKLAQTYFHFLGRTYLDKLRVEDVSVIVHAFDRQVGPDTEGDRGEADTIGEVFELATAATDRADLESFVGAVACIGIR